MLDVFRMLARQKGELEIRTVGGWTRDLCDDFSDEFEDQKLRVPVEVMETTNCWVFKRLRNENIYEGEQMRRERDSTPYDQAVFVGEPVNSKSEIERHGGLAAGNAKTRFTCNLEEEYLLVANVHPSMICAIPCVHHRSHKRSNIPDRRAHVTKRCSWFHQNCTQPVAEEKMKA
jgi:hypothetical protein